MQEGREVRGDLLAHMAFARDPQGLVEPADRRGVLLAPIDGGRDAASVHPGDHAFPQAAREAVGDPGQHGMVVAEDRPDRGEVRLRPLDDRFRHGLKGFAGQHGFARPPGECPEPGRLALDGPGQRFVDQFAVEAGGAYGGDVHRGPGGMAGYQRDHQTRMDLQEHRRQSAAQLGDRPDLELRVRDGLDAAFEPCPAPLVVDDAPPRPVGALPRALKASGAAPDLEELQVRRDRQVVRGGPGVLAPGPDQFAPGPLDVVEPRVLCRVVGDGPQPEPLFEESPIRIPQPLERREDLFGRRVRRDREQPVSGDRAGVAQALGRFHFGCAPANLPQARVHGKPAEPEGVAAVEVHVCERGQVESAAAGSPLRHVPLRPLQCRERPTATPGPVPAERPAEGPPPPSNGNAARAARVPGRSRRNGRGVSRWAACRHGNAL